MSLKKILIYGLTLTNASNLRVTERHRVDPRTVERKQAVNIGYVPSKAEQYVLDAFNANSLKTSGCDIYLNKDSGVYKEVNIWVVEVERYHKYIHDRTEFAPDVRALFDIDYNNKEDVCQTYSDPPLSEEKNETTGLSLEKKKDLNYKYFLESKELSYSPTQGFMEPLLPPFRHPKFCLTGSSADGYTIDYLVEDFGHVCRNILTKESETAFFDIGATYNFINEEIDRNSPEIRLIEKYRKFGIHFDDIFTYEIVKRDFNKYKTIPEHMKKAMSKPMHWMNDGISIEPGHVFNPWTMVLDKYKPEDFVVVKLDIDDSSLELPLVQQLLDNPDLHKLVDVFYFEHHVKMDEMKKHWNMNGTMQYSLNVFRALRNVGIASHYWI